MRVLFTANSGAGHISPLLPFARAFRRAGAEVVLAAPVESHELVEAAGLPWHPLPDPPNHEIAKVQREFPNLTNEQQGERMLRDAWAGLFAAASLPEVLRAAASADLILSEPTEFAGLLAAQRHDVPFARIGIWAGGLGPWDPALVAPVLDAHRARLGLAPDPDNERLTGSPLLTVFPAALEHTHVPAVRFREPPAEPWPLPDWWENDEDPLVYVTYGSVLPQRPDFRERIRATVEALGTLPVRVLFTVGRRPELGDVPANVRVERWIPQEQVMPHAAAMVGHGGSGTTRIALAAGVPSVVIPHFADQPRNAQRVAALGAGIALESPAGLADALRAVLEDPGYRAAARTVAEDIAALPAVDEAPRIWQEHRLAA